MASNNKAKLKLLSIQRMLVEETDAEHGLTMTQILTKLQAEGIPAERKSIYRDLEVLREFGLDIKTYQRNPVEYALEHRDFTLSELMLMVDTVASSKFLTQRQANTLIGNIKSLASLSQQEKLGRRIHVKGRIRLKTEGVFESIDLIHSALRTKKKLKFRYLHYGVDGKRHPSHDGKPYVVTPVAISYDDGFYYLTAWSADHEAFTEYRIDRMDRLSVSNEDADHNEEIAQYSFTKDEYEVFGRFDGPEETVTLRVQADKVEIIMDRFGDNVEFIPSTEDHAKVLVRVCVSPQFFGWVAGLNNMVTIQAPQSLVNDYKDYLRSLVEGC